MTTTFGFSQSFTLTVKDASLKETATLSFSTNNENGVFVITPSLPQGVSVINPLYRWYNSADKSGGSINDGTVNPRTGERRIPIVPPLKVGDPFSYWVTVSGDNTCESDVNRAYGNIDPAPQPISLTFVNSVGGAITSVNGGELVYIKGVVVSGVTVTSVGGTQLRLSSSVPPSSAVSGMDYSGLINAVVFSEGVSSTIVGAFTATNRGSLGLSTTLVWVAKPNKFYPAANTPTITIFDTTGQSDATKRVVTISSGSITEGLSKTLTASLPLSVTTASPLTVTIQSNQPFPSGYTLSTVLGGIQSISGSTSFTVVIPGIGGSTSTVNSVSFTIGTAYNSDLLDRVFVLSGSVSSVSGMNFTVNGGTLTVTSIPQGLAFTIEPTPQSVVEGMTATFTLKRSATSASDVLVNLTSSASVLGFTIQVPTTVRMGANSTSVDFSVPTVDNRHGAGISEDFTISQGDASASYNVESAILKVLAYNALTLVSDRYAVPEGSSVSITLSSVRRVALEDGPVSLSVTRSAVSSTNGTNISTTLTILPNNSVASFSVTLALSNTVGEDEVLVVQAIDPSGVYTVNPISITVQAYPVVLVSGPITSICSGGTALLSSVIRNYDSNKYSYRLGSPTAAVSDLRVSQSGVYQVYATNKRSNLTSKVGVSITVTINPAISLKLTSSEGFICGLGNSLDLRSYIESVTGTTGYDLSVIDPSNRSSSMSASGPHMVSQLGKYVIIARDSRTGCEGRAVLQVSQGSVPIISASPTIKGYRPYAIDLTLVPTGSNVERYEYYSSGAISSMTVGMAKRITEGGTYYIRGVSKEGCVSNQVSVVVSFGSTPTLQMRASTPSIEEGERGYFVLSLVDGDDGVSPVRLQQDIMFTSEQDNVHGNTEEASDCIIYGSKTFPFQVRLPAHETSVSITVEALKDKVLFDNDNLVLKESNELGSVYASMLIKDIDGKDASNRVISIDDGTIYYEDEIPIGVRLPKDITLEKSQALSVSINQDPSSSLSHLSVQPEFNPKELIIKGGDNYGMLQVKGSSNSDTPAYLVLDGSVAAVDGLTFTVKKGTITILNQKIGAQMSVSDNEDTINAFSEIKNIEKFPNNEVSIMDRWGIVVWEARGYNNTDVVFRGRSNQVTYGIDKPVPEGVYYYVIRFIDKGKEEIYKGHIS